MVNLTIYVAMEPERVQNGTPFLNHEVYVEHQNRGKEKVDFSGDESPHSMVIDEEGWKYIEVVGCFDELEGIGGGGFMLRDSEDTALLAQAFPTLGNSILFAEADAFHKAMKRIVDLREEKCTFFLDSEPLFDCFYGRCLAPDFIRPMVQECINWGAENPFFRVVLRQKEDLRTAEWLAYHGMRCQQHCKWDRAGPWHPGLEEIM